MSIPSLLIESTDSMIGMHSLLIPRPSISQLLMLYNLLPLFVKSWETEGLGLHLWMIQTCNDTDTFLQLASHTTAKAAI